MKKHARVGVPHYTYRQKNTEEKTVYRRLAIISGLTLILVVIIWFWGVTFIRIIGSLNTNDTNSPAKTSLVLPLQKPTLNDVPEFTNEEKITISGSTSSGTNLKLIVNGTEVSKTTGGISGSFSFIDVPLKEGLNLLKIIASNDADETQEERILITLDKTKPALQVASPSDKQSFPKDTDTITVKGKSDPDATVLVNSIQAIIDQNGNFSYLLPVSPGENKVEIKTTDKAGNSEVTNLTVTVAK